MYVYWLFLLVVFGLSFETTYIFFLVAEQKKTLL